jgi:hypothetical protein
LRAQPVGELSGSTAAHQRHERANGSAVGCFGELVQQRAAHDRAKIGRSEDLAGNAIRRSIDF